MFKTMATYCHPVQSQCILGKAGQVTHFLSPTSGFAQKTLHPNCTVEATYGILMGCRCQDIAHLCSLLVYSTAECCTPVWCRSMHTRLIGSILNDALRIVTGYLRPTPTEELPVLAGIQPAELRR